MTIDFSATPDDNSPNGESESPMFAPIPSWERGKKRRAFGSGLTRSDRVAAEPRSFAAERDPVTGTPVAAPMSRPAVDTLGDVDAADPTFAAGPAFGDRTRKSRMSTTAPIAIAAGLILIGGLTAVGWYATQPHNTGVAELTPGASTTTTTTAAPGDASGNEVAQNTAPPLPPAATTTTTTTHGARSEPPTVTRTVTHARPVSRSASDVSADASTTAPVTAPVHAAPAPAATPAAPPAAAATPAPLVLNLPKAAPAQVAPTTTAPAETPLPTQTAPAAAPPPTQTPPN